MGATSYKLSTAFFTLASLCFVTVAIAQTQPQPFGQSAAAARSTTTAMQPTASMDAQREQIWNSPNMLRARAWLKDYCSKSAKVTPELAKEYETELANMSPTQMKIWLMKFDEEEQQRQQQYAMFQQGNAAAMQQAMAAHRQTQQAYAAINQASSQAAQNAQGQINEQRAAAQSEFENKQLEQSAYPYGYGGGYGGGYGPYGFSPYGNGGIHYHYHIYGN